MGDGVGVGAVVGEGVGVGRGLGVAVGVAGAVAVKVGVVEGGMAVDNIFAIYVYYLRQDLNGDVIAVGANYRALNRMYLFFPSDLLYMFGECFSCVFFHMWRMQL